ncbi:hypothetical protein T05_13433 [Trichinella murrelli]|uniref:Uncharacterized protein n=1 Tax=Trichinella murrelli TaxID=144512 RepID=A0A0V0UD37_9BILA|nr:hypothetical protein T05_13433 [Trichinella murrelli]
MEFNLDSYSVDYKIGKKLNEARLAQSVEHGTLNPRVVGSSPTSGYFIACSFINPRRHLYKTTRYGDRTCMIERFLLSCTDEISEYM